MNLHLDQKLFSDTLRATAKSRDIRLEFVEKDYWITLVLNRLAVSKYVGTTIFKGGTSLSKAFQLMIGSPKIWIWLLLPKMGVQAMN